MLGSAALALALPVVAQEAPESLLPPGFGDAPEAPPPAPGAPRPATPGQPTQLLPPETSFAPPAVTPTVATNEAGEELSDEELAAERQKYDLPDGARRSLDRIGPLTPRSRGLASNAFGTASGPYLATLMKQTRAPVVSRWASILLRRALLSSVDTPAGIDGADWVAERAWLLLRMGEADSARLLVQSVDADNFTPRLYAVAMQTYLATADPAGLCPLALGARKVSKEPAWTMSEPICAALSGDQGTASGSLNQIQRRGVIRGVDYRLGEKVVGTGFNARRSVKIEWEGVDRLTAWRFGLATALNVEIPAPLYATAGSHVRAWEARAPALSAARRVPGAEIAAQLGVFSSAALVGLYAQAGSDGDAPAEVADRVGALRAAHAARTVGARIDAMRQLWGAEAAPSYLGLIATARAAAALPVAQADASDAARLIASMLSAGYDRNAARWARALGQISGAGNGDAWALLAVGAPSVAVDINEGQISGYAGAASAAKARALIAALAGLARLSPDVAGQLATDKGFTLAANSRWSRAIAAAAQRGEQGTVALLAAVGMQANGWAQMSPAHLYHVVAALHRVGLDPEARMIAAEAISRL